MSRISHEALAKYIRQRREELNITQAEIAKKMGYTSAQFISNIERGTANPPLNVIVKLISYLKLDSEHVMDLYMQGTEEVLRQVLKRPGRVKAIKQRTR